MVVKKDFDKNKILIGWVGIDKTLPMELAEPRSFFERAGCHPVSVAGYKGSSARTQVVSEPATIILFGLGDKFHF
jgi:hypothetical protein